MFFLQILFLFSAFCYKMYLGYLNNTGRYCFSALLTGILSVQRQATHRRKNNSFEVIAHDFQSDFTEYH